MTTGAITRHSGPAQWSVDPTDGGRLTSLVVAGHELIAQPGDVVVEPHAASYAYGGFPMAPWAGRIGLGLLDVDGTTHHLPTRGDANAMHGTTYDRVWEVAEEDDEGVVLRTDLGPDWPFSGTASLAWRSTSDGLLMRLSVLADERMPAWVGIHPWFRRELDDRERVVLDFDAQQMYVRGADLLPTGELVAVPTGPWDDCFTGVQSAHLTWGDLVLTMTASSDIWVIYNERVEAICVEPQTAPPDAVRLGQAPWLDKGDEHALEVAFRWSSSGT
jgi:galactose mutarotase-like enzyme